MTLASVKLAVVNLVVAEEDEEEEEVADTRVSEPRVNNGVSSPTPMSPTAASGGRLKPSLRSPEEEGDNEEEAAAARMHFSLVVFLTS